MHNAVTSGFAFAGWLEMQVSRGSFSGPYQRCARMRMQGVRGEMWPLSCGYAQTDTPMRPLDVELRMHAQGMPMQCPGQANLDGDRARSGPRGAAVASRRAIWARFRRSLVLLTAWVSMVSGNSL
jgi:hypothetical protein